LLGGNPSPRWSPESDQEKGCTMFSTAQEAHDAKWYSRRHQTSAENYASREAREARMSAKARNAQKRIEAAVKRSPSDQLRRLDQRLGAGVGAENERARLTARIG
jgi:hypothetical protein